MPALEVRLSKGTAERVDRLIEVLERVAAANEKLADLADLEANGARG